MSASETRSTPQTELLSDATSYTIGGTIWRVIQSAQGSQRVPWKKVTVELLGWSRFIETDDQGRYRFNKLQPGDYTLIVRQKADPPQEGVELQKTSITVAPPPSYDVTIWVTQPANQPPPASAGTQPEAAEPTQASTTEPREEQTPAGEVTQPVETQPSERSLVEEQLPSAPKDQAAKKRKSSPADKAK